MKMYVRALTIVFASCLALHSVHTTWWFRPEFKDGKKLDELFSLFQALMTKNVELTTEETIVYPQYDDDQKQFKMPIENVYRTIQEGVDLAEQYDESLQEQRNKQNLGWKIDYPLLPDRLGSMCQTDIIVRRFLTFWGKKDLDDTFEDTSKYLIQLRKDENRFENVHTQDPTALDDQRVSLVEKRERVATNIERVSKRKKYFKDLAKQQKTSKEQEFALATTQLGTNRNHLFEALKQKKSGLLKDALKEPLTFDQWMKEYPIEGKQ